MGQTQLKPQQHLTSSSRYISDTVHQSSWSTDPLVLFPATPETLPTLVGPVNGTVERMWSAVRPADALVSSPMTILVSPIRVSERWPISTGTDTSFVTTCSTGTATSRITYSKRALSPRSYCVLAHACYSPQCSMSEEKETLFLVLSADRRGRENAMITSTGTVTSFTTTFSSPYTGTGTSL